VELEPGGGVEREHAQQERELVGPEPRSDEVRHRQRLLTHPEDPLTVGTAVVERPDIHGVPVELVGDDRLVTPPVEPLDDLAHRRGLRIVDPAPDDDDAYAFAVSGQATVHIDPSR